MARTARNSSLETRTARARLRIRRTPYFAKIAKGLRLGYYRGQIAGSWVARCYRGAGVYATEALGVADDTLDADGVKVLDYWQAQEHARRWGERQRLIARAWCAKAPYSVADAVKDYLAGVTSWPPSPGGCAPNAPRPSPRHPCGRRRRGRPPRPQGYRQPHPHQGRP
ncbi:hypothetical protein [Bradyrhizobium sp. URHD0069]|uniref:hypothetical protein n=1 Tax=Bradyrhizobium sp. URHD0069 TaxID=1380355 RepID=UPI0004978911|nr:hypothetical protein [Bradyrhizobium sp. URHD0069]